jgi:dipeptidyl aminopeptidase/acylaminoacyl peptidase
MAAGDRHRVVHAACEGPRLMTPEVLWAIPRVGPPAPSPDGSLVATAVTTWAEGAPEAASRIHVLHAEGGEPRALTAEDRHATDPAFSPDGTRLAFVSRPRIHKRGEKPAHGQVHVIPLGGGEAERVTDLPMGTFAPRWLPDGSGLVFGAWLLHEHADADRTRRELERREKAPLPARVTEERLYRYWDEWLAGGRVPHLFHLDFATEVLTDLMPGSVLWFPWMEPGEAFDVAPDGHHVAFEGIAPLGPDARPRSDVYEVPLEGGPPVRLTEGNPADSLRPRYAPDGTVVYGRTEDPDFYADRVRLVRYDPARGTHEGILEDWALSPHGWEPDAKGGLWFSAEDDGRVRVFSLPPRAANDVAPRPRTDIATSTNPRPAGELVVYLRHDLSDPPELYALAPEVPTPTRITRFTDAALEDVALGEVRSMRFAGGGDEEVQMFVVMPPGTERRDGPHPLVHLIHGGPHGVFGDAWFWRWHAHTFAARGYACAMVNFQGSTSWGQDFAQRIQGAWGDRPYHDVMRATDVLVQKGVADEARMAIAGGSYGGYLTAWIASQTSRFACAVNHAGVYDLALEMASDHTWGWGRAMGGLPWDGQDRVDRWDPSRHSAGLSTPMLVVHGEKDYRVPVAQALLCYGVLKAKGIPARLVYFPDENHWILSREASLLWYREVLGWLHRHLDR